MHSLCVVRLPRGKSKLLESKMSRLQGSFLRVFIRAFAVILLVDLVGRVSSAETAAEGTQSVGKLRSKADEAFAKGEIDQSLKLWAQVSVL